MIKILLVDDHKLVLESLKELLSTIDNVEVSATFENPNMVLPFLEENKIDIIITDCNMPAFSGIDLILKLKENHPKQKVLLLSMEESAENIKDAIKAGTNGYILKKSGKNILEHAINEIYNGRNYYSNEVINQLAMFSGEDLNDALPENIYHLTIREIEIIKLIASELSTNQIAEKLFISTATVESHRAKIMKKLNVKSSIGVTKYAIKHDMIEN
jgi:DNA-binding NarL/FixJ family response regulator